jgi:hypothetical protein
VHHQPGTTHYTRPALANRFPQTRASPPIWKSRLDKAIADKRVWNLHRLVVLRNRRLVLERYFEEEIVRAA